MVTALTPVDTTGFRKTRNQNATPVAHRQDGEFYLYFYNLWTKPAGFVTRPNAPIK